MSNASDASGDVAVKAKEKLMSYDQSVVGAAAMKAGKDVWSSMSWPERLSAVAAHEDQGKPQPVQKPPSTATSRPPVAPASLPSMPASASGSGSGAAPEPTISRQPSRTSAASQNHKKVTLPPSQPSQPSQPSHHTTPEQQSLALSVASAAASKTSVGQRPPSETGSKVSREEVASKPASVHSSKPPSVRTASLPPTPQQQSAPRSPVEEVTVHANLSLASSVLTPAPADLVLEPVPSKRELQDDALSKQVKTLQGQVKTWKAKATKFEKMAARLESEKGVGQQEAALRQAEDELQMKDEQLEQAGAELSRQAAIIQELREGTHAQLLERDQQLARLREELNSIEDPELLISQIWTLERALALRNDEIAKKNIILDEFVGRIEDLDRELADALKKLLNQAQEEAAAEEKEVFGGISAEDAVGAASKKRKEGRRKRRGSKDAGSAAEVNVLSAELKILKHENEQLRSRLTVMSSRNSIVSDQDTRNQVMEKQMMISSLQQQLQKAQEAIISGVETGAEMRRESELKLRETRGVLKNLLSHKQSIVTSLPSPPRDLGVMDTNQPVWSDGAEPLMAFSSMDALLGPRSLPPAPAPETNSRGRMASTGPTGQSRTISPVRNSNQPRLF